MRAEAALAAAAGATVAALAGLAALLRLRRARAKEGGLAPRALLEATAVRFVLTLAGALALALGWRAEAKAVLVGVAVGYLVLLAIETRWALGGSRAANR